MVALYHPSGISSGVIRWLAAKLLTPAAVDALETILWHCAEAADIGGLVTQTLQRI